jgi:hypothetical protein
MSTLTELEAVLRPAIETASHNRGRLPPWHEYTFQYQGRASLLGQQYVYVNGFCSYSQGDLRAQWVEVFDGGACFFHAKYEPASKRLYDVVVNGVA